ncbi:MAG: ABC transporter permease [Bifidobacteriaceae bacterium]|jgi:D-methionine transport system permease protein|nr:ABC transporter permease [Bifidobacteriaceae bacterium]
MFAFELERVLTESLALRTWETVAQTVVSLAITVALGLPIGLAVVTTAPDGLRPQRAVYAVLSAVVNLGRAVPFIILMTLLIPFTRLLVGSILSWRAAVVPLAVGAIPFFARVAETALRGVLPGKIEAALMAGASRWQVAWGLLVRESMPGLVGGVTVTAVTLVGYSMITGTIGGGGLGYLAYNYGYSRYMLQVQLAVVIVAVLIIFIFQLAGDAIARRLDHTR